MKRLIIEIIFMYCIHNFAVRFVCISSFLSSTAAANFLISAHDARSSMEITSRSSLKDIAGYFDVFRITHWTRCVANWHSYTIDKKMRFNDTTRHPETYFLIYFFVKFLQITHILLFRYNWNRIPNDEVYQSGIEMRYDDVTEFPVKFAWVQLLHMVCLPVH